MESPRILFNNKKVDIKTESIISPNVRKPIVKDKTLAKPRQTRSDKKHDIKINLTAEQRQLLKRVTKKMKDSALRNREEISPTFVCTHLLKKALLMKEIDFPEVPYPKSDSKKGRAKLDEKYYNLLFDYTVKWDYSYAKAAHRIFSFILEMEARRI
ncbi:hypothetical protein [Bacillus massiliglaciei]|uniref:hypothetical protein n=1 Tax=Bacillus massiliglaciei TaxID=1816693 RepID=UPI000DA60B61|nr:hypothetical protein [Bacillus massiliglaciei]